MKIKKSYIEEIEANIKENPKNTGYPENLKEEKEILKELEAKFEEQNKLHENIKNQLAPEATDEDIRAYFREERDKEKRAKKAVDDINFDRGVPAVVNKRLYDLMGEDFTAVQSPDGVFYKVGEERIPTMLVDKIHIPMPETFNHAMAMEFDESGSARGHIWTAHPTSDLSSITGESRTDRLGKLNTDLANAEEKNLKNLEPEQMKNITDKAADYIDEKYSGLSESDRAKMTEKILEHHGFTES